jgi:hypothetical protein
MTLRLSVVNRHAATNYDILGSHAATVTTKESRDSNGIITGSTTAYRNTSSRGGSNRGNRCREDRCDITILPRDIFSFLSPFSNRISITRADTCRTERAAADMAKSTTATTIVNDTPSSRGVAGRVTRCGHRRSRGRGARSRGGGGEGMGGKEESVRGVGNVARGGTEHI